jgi:hypothetical protein
VARFLVVLILACFIGQASGIVEAIAGCVEACADDDDAGNCAPTCSDCPCCGQVRSIASVPALGVPELCPIGQVATPASRAIAEVEPREISHVPKLALV